MYRIQSFLLLATLLGLHVIPAHALTWSEAFNRPGLVGRVFTVGVYQDQLIAGGHEFEGRGVQIDHIARLEGNDWKSLGEGISGLVRDVAVYQGELIAAGEFGSAGGQPTNSIAAWNGEQWRPLGGGLELTWGVHATVFALEVFDGELYAGGLLDLAGGDSVLGLARWDGETWRDVGGGINGPWEPKVLSLETDPVAGLLYVGGEFDQAGGVQTDNIAAWDGMAWQTVGGGISGAIGTGIHSLEVFDGQICAGGNFTLADVPGARRIACLDNGQWQALGLGIPDWDISVEVSSLQVYNGDLYVGGDFIEVDGVGGVFSRAVARWDGGAWHSVGGIDGTDLATTAIAMTVHDNRLVVAGEFKWAGTTLDYGEVTVSWNIAGYDGQHWNGYGQGLGLLGGPNRLIPYAGGIVGTGGFYTAGDELVGRIALLRNGRWEPFGIFDGFIDDALLYQGDLVVTGNFEQVNGTTVGHTAIHDGTDWQAFGNGLGGDVMTIFQDRLVKGGLGGVREWDGSQWQSFGPQLFGQVNALHVHDDGRLYIGGYFGTPDDSINNIAAWDGSNMDALAGGADRSVSAFLSRDGELLVGGAFEEIAGQPIERLAVYDGAGWSQFGSGIQGGAVSAMHVHQGRLLVAGNFTTFYGLPADFLLRWNGQEWEGLGDLNGFPRDFLPVPGSDSLYVSGSFTEIDGIPAHGMSILGDAGIEMVFAAGFE